MADEAGEYEVQELDPRVFQVPEFLPGQKVQLTIGSTTKHAEVRFVGPLTGMKGFWLGVQYEDKASRAPPRIQARAAAPLAARRSTSPAAAPLLSPPTPSLTASCDASPPAEPARGVPCAAILCIWYGFERAVCACLCVLTSIEFSGWQERRPAQWAALLPLPSRPRRLCARQQGSLVGA